MTGIIDLRGWVRQFQASIVKMIDALTLRCMMNDKGVEVYTRATVRSGA